MDHPLSDQGSPRTQETALIVHPVLKGKVASAIAFSLEDQIEEAEGLVRAIKLKIIETKVVNLGRPAPGYLLGKGTIAEIADYAAETEPDVIIVNHILSPVQQRNLEREWHAKVIDRTGLILEIFGERAQTREGKIQVELAALEYQRSRLVRSWTHLERQRGGAGFMGGPGETQIEIDRRLIADRVGKLKKDLEHVRKTREMQKRSREKVPFPVVSLVGYTNAGKSTLFNRLTGANVFAEDLPFATLDPTVRKLILANGMEVIFSDTVGFIADLPTHLVAAFRATLEQVQDADIILHVRDISRPDHEAQKDEVIKTLAALKIEYEQDGRILEVHNKIDAVPEDERADILRKAKFSGHAVAVSALTGEGMEELLKAIEDLLSRGRRTVLFSIPPGDGEALAWLHRHAHVLEMRNVDSVTQVMVNMAPADLGRFTDRFSYAPEQQADKTERRAGHGS